MKKSIWINGLISGVVIATVMVCSAGMCAQNSDFQGSMVLGYAAMLLASAFIFIGVRSFRDKHNGGVITFGKAFLIGLYIALISSTIYVVTWLITYYTFMPDFMDRYTEFVLRQAEESGATPAMLAAQTAEMAEFKEMYRNPLVVVLFTYLEILPIELLVTLISALILKRKTPKGQLQTT